MADCNVLLVEDHPDTLKVLARLLGAVGCRVTTAASVADAEARVADGRFDLLISDFGLPDGNGIDVLRHVRATAPGIPAIVLTGYDNDEDVQTCLAAGFTMHLVKPIELTGLKAAVDKVMGR